MNDMHDLLSGAFPAPEDEPPQRDLVDAAMDWGQRRRRRDWGLTGVTALAVVAVGAGVATMAGGTRAESSPSPGSGPLTTRGVAPSGLTAQPTIPADPSGTACATSKWAETAYCIGGMPKENFTVEFAQGSERYIQAALPHGYTVKWVENSYVLFLTGPDGKTNYLFPSVEGAGTLDGHLLDCGTPARAGCVQTSANGGKVVVNSGPSDGQSAGFVKNGLQEDPRIDILVGTATAGAVPGIPAPTATNALLSNTQLAAVMADPAFLNYAKLQYQHYLDLERQWQSGYPSDTSSSPQVSGLPPSGTTATSASIAAGSMSPPSSPIGNSATSSPTSSATTTVSGR